jgi:hypothetical protein
MVNEILDEQVKVYYFWLYIYQREYIDRRLGKIEREKSRLVDELIKKNVPDWTGVENGVDSESFSRVLHVVFKSSEYKKIQQDKLKAEEAVYAEFESSNPMNISGNNDWGASGVLEALHEGAAFEDVVDEVMAERIGSGAGIELIGIRHNSISQSGNFNGEIIVGIDISRPLNVLAQEIERIQNLQFESIPTYAQLFDRMEFGEKDVLLEKHLIRQCGGALKSGYAPRAIGLWLSCYVHKNKCSQKSAIKALFDSFEDLSFLGKADVEDSDLRKYYRFTEACIDAAEVLPFTQKGTTKRK